MQMTFQPEQRFVSPGCTMGTMAVTGLQNPDRDALITLRTQAEEAIRAAYGSLTRAQLRDTVPMAAYVAYYKKFGSTYHVLPQVESIVRGKGIPAVLAPVCVMFMAELQTSLLTAAHDLDAVMAPYELKQASGDETYLTLDGRETAAVQGDWMVRDGAGVISSILRGPDQRTAVTAESQNVLYVVYAPEGIDPARISAHFAMIRQMLSQVYGANA